MATLTTSRSTDLKSRVEDYLNDQIQTTADLDNVDNLLARVQEQQSLLKKQLQDAKKDHEEAKRNVQNEAEALRKRIQTFQQQQVDIDGQLMTVTNSTASDEAVKKFESRMTKLRRLEIANGYLDLLKEFFMISDESRQQLKVNLGASLDSYLKLRSIRNRVRVAQPAAEGAAPHVVDHIEHDTNKVFEELRNVFCTELEKTLEKMKWPQKELQLSGDVLDNWTEQTELLLKLQEPDLLGKSQDRVPQTDLENAVVLPLEVMVQPLSARFRYHFYGEKPTNRLDKPEYFLSHILDLLDRHNTFMTDFLQPVLDSRIQQQPDLENVYTDAVSSFITALLPLVTAKSLSILPQISKQPQLFSHLVHELMSFDSTIRDSWAYAPVPGPSSEWKGVTWSVLTTHGYFNSWLKVEKDFALTRYKSIRDAPESGEIDFHGTEPSQTKPSKGAIRVNDLLETITDRYRFLSSFSQKMKFLMEVQLSIFDDYHGHLHGALQAYLASSHTAGRILQSQSKAEAFGLKGVSTLSKIYGSSEFLERKMSDWSDDIFFLELWEELQDRAKTNSGNNASLGRDLRVEDVAAKTSAMIAANGSEDGLESVGGALFDETASSYRRLREHSESEIDRALDVNIADAIRPFAEVSLWSSLSNTTSSDSSLAPSAGLDSLLQAISTLLGYLSSVLGVAPLRRVAKHFCSTVQRELYDNVLMRHSFSASGTAQLKRDLVAVEEAVDTQVKSPGLARSSMRRFNEALILLGLPIRKSDSKTNVDDDFEDAWDFEDNEAADVEDGELPEISQDDGSREQEKVWGLWEVERHLFKNNDAARYILSELRLSHVGVNDARNILKRRIEINS